MNSQLTIKSFFTELSGNLLPNSVIVSDAGNTGFSVSQHIRLKNNMRYITSGQMDMGAGLPMSIGVAMATKSPVVAIIGDGSFQLNIQELVTIAYHKLPIKIFVINNAGLACIRNSQKRWCKSRFIGVNEDSGLGFPKLCEITNAYEIEYFNWNKDHRYIQQVLKSDKPVICEVFTDPNEIIKSPFMGDYK